MRNPEPESSRRPGFTLTELMVVALIVLTLAVITITGITRLMDRAKCVVDANKLRGIHRAVVSRATENNDIAFTKEEIGGSPAYREWRDPLSLCQVLHDYLPGEDAWTSPKATKAQIRFKNSYAWSTNYQIAYDPTSTPSERNPTPGRYSAIPKPILLAFNCYCYTLPAGFNRYQSSALQVAPRNRWYRPWNGGKSVNRLWTDGRVESFDQP